MVVRLGAMRNEWLAFTSGSPSVTLGFGPAMSYKSARGYVPLRQARPAYGIPAVGKSGPIRHGCADHVHRREGDEVACRCGKRWPVGEGHP